MPGKNSKTKQEKKEANKNQNGRLQEKEEAARNRIRLNVHITG